MSPPLGVTGNPVSYFDTRTAAVEALAIVSLVAAMKMMAAPSTPAPAQTPSTTQAANRPAVTDEQGGTPQ
jgi:hypothetical protein